MATVSRRTGNRTLVFNSGFEGDKISGYWQTREIDYGSSRSHPSCVNLWNGKMTLGVRKDSDGRLITGHTWVPGVPFVYGWFEARIKFHRLTGSHGAFWLQTEPAYVTPDHTEIDIAECFGNRNIHHSIYWRKEGQSWDDFHNGSGPGKIADSTQVDDQAVFLDYALDWRPERLDFYIGQNGDFVKTFGTADTDALSDVPHYLVLSHLVKDWEIPKLDQSRLPDHKTYVEYVKVWQ